MQNVELKIPIRAEQLLLHDGDYVMFNKNAFYVFDGQFRYIAINVNGKQSLLLNKQYLVRYPDGREVIMEPEEFNLHFKL